jgi:hypothetical protein
VGSDGSADADFGTNGLTIVTEKKWFESFAGPLSQLGDRIVVAGATIWGNAAPTPFVSRYWQ